MHFCSECHNMYYLKIRDDNEEVADSLIYYCRNCGHEDATLSGESICVSDTQLRRSEQKYTHMVNEYTKYDPTLPRINTIKCPNQECSSNGGAINVGGGGTKTAAQDPNAPESKKPKTKITLKRKEATVQAQEQAPAQASASAQAQAAQAQAAQAQAAAQAHSEKQNSNREVIYIRYDDINMKYVYLCVHCDTTWKTDNR